jgi:hypothetical protein
MNRLPNRLCVPCPCPYLCPVDNVPGQFCIQREITLCARPETHRLPRIRWHRIVALRRASRHTFSPIPRNTNNSLPKTRDIK